MTFRTKEEMFGDDGSNGAAVPYSTTNPAGTGSKNRGIGLGEQLTAAVANRPHYALAENDEDLNARLTPFEADGLDAPYRLGTTDLPGGGRVIELDGGPVETQSALATIYAADPANAHFRANALGDTAGGGTGFDFVGRNRSGGDVPSYGFLDRRTLELAEEGITEVALHMTGTLNAAGADAALLTVDVDWRFTGDDDTTYLLLGIDLVEIEDGDYAGLYRLEEIVGSHEIKLVTLTRSAPSFDPNTPVTFTMYRPTFSTSVGHGSGRGVVVVGQPYGPNNSAPAALTLVATARSLDVWGGSAEGSAYAYVVLQFDDFGGVAGWSAWLKMNGDAKFGDVEVSDLEVAGDAEIGGAMDVAGQLEGGAIRLRAAKAVVDAIVPLVGAHNITRSADATSWERDPLGYWTLTGEDEQANSLAIPLAGVVPWGATVTGLKLSYRTGDGYDSDFDLVVYEYSETGTLNALDGFSIPDSGGSTSELVPALTPFTFTRASPKELSIYRGSTSLGAGRSIQIEKIEISFTFQNLDQ